MSKIANLVQKRALALLSSGDIRERDIVDVGAFVGSYTKQFAALDGFRVLAVEACPVNADILRRGVGHLDNVRVVECAVADKNGVVQFYTQNHPGTAGTSQSNSLYRTFVGDQRRCKSAVRAIAVKSRTLGQLMDDYGIDLAAFAKFNCEGGEYKIFSDRGYDFLDRLRAFSLSMHGKSRVFSSSSFKQSRRRIVDRIRESGFILCVGDTDLDSDRHVDQLWVHKSLPV